MDDNKKMGGNGLTLEKPRKRVVNNNVVVESFDEEQ